MKDSVLIEINWPSPNARPPLVDNQIHLWAALLDAPAPSLPAPESLLSRDEIQRAQRFHFQRDRDRYVRTRATLRIVLAWHLKMEPARVVFDYQPAGKPFLKAGQSGSPLYFNLSHSAGLMVLAVSRACPLGVDVEQIAQLDDADGMAKHFFSSQEQAAWQQVPPSERMPAFFDLWTRKEAVIKATGEGISDSSVQCETLSTEEAAVKCIDTRLGTILIPEWTLHRFEPAPGFKAAAAVPRRDLVVWTGRWGIR